MKCDEMQELLSLYIDKKLDEGEIKAVEEHLSACDACRREYNELKDMIDLLGQAEMVPVPDAFSFRMKKALKEEKQSMIDTGLIERGAAKKKNRWRIIASVAAVFMVGVLSFGFYDDVLGTLTDQLSAKDQAGTAQSEKPLDIYSGVVGDSTDDAADNRSAGSSQGGSAAMKERNSGLQPVAKALNPADVGDRQPSSINNEKKMAVGGEDAQVPKSISMMAGGSDTNTGEESTASGATLSDTAADGNAAPNALTEFDWKNYSRSLTDPGIERSVSVQYYEELIKEKLADFDYQILSSECTQTGERQFKVFIFRDQDGNTYNEEITIIGKDKKIKVASTNKFTELFNDEDDNN